MGKLLVTEWISLDGFVAGPGGDMSFVGTHMDAQMGRYESEFAARGELLLLGHRTYDSFASSWPSVPDSDGASAEEKEYARMLNDMKKVVVSHELFTPSWEGTNVVTTLDASHITRLKDRGDVIVYGSISVVRALLSLGVIDELQLLVYPILLGGGARLFEEDGVRRELRLASTELFHSGVQLLTYTQTTYVTV